MTITIGTLAVVAFLSVLEPQPPGMSSRNGRFHLESPAFADGALIPAIHTADGLDLSPPLRWGGAPAGTGSFALVMEDPDAPAGTWVHWVLFNIPADLQALPSGLDRSPQLANGARHGGCWGVREAHRIGYQGPEPPPGPMHRYVFSLYALDGSLSLEPAVTLARLRPAMQGHQLAVAQLTGLYRRRP
ncbi:MAG: YbhB/YbcL family Raf kinase inhibitor-like protein [Cyanobacteriota bacterium]